MNVSELKYALRFANDEDEVAILVNLGSYVGGSHTVKTSYGAIGFDWNKGKFLIAPSVELRPKDFKEEK